MLLHDIIWILMQHSRSWSMLTLDVFLTVINLIYKNLFYHQPFDGSLIINKLKLFVHKKKYMFG